MLKSCACEAGKPHPNPAISMTSRVAAILHDLRDNLYSCWYSRLVTLKKKLHSIRLATKASRNACDRKSWSAFPKSSFKNACTLEMELNNLPVSIQWVRVFMTFHPFFYFPGFFRLNAWDSVTETGLYQTGHWEEEQERKQAAPKMWNPVIGWLR